MIELIGWAGMLMLVMCLIPQAIHSIRTKRFEGLSIFSMVLCFFGELFTLVYISFEAFRWPLFLNYMFNLIIIGTILIYYFKYGRKRGKEK